MSDHVVPIDGSEVEGEVGLLARVRELLREPELLYDGQARTITYRFTPDLTLAELTTFSNLRATLRSRIRFTDAEMDALRPDVEGLRTYQGLASPTAAQTAQATKAIIRILRAVFRD